MQIGEQLDITDENVNCTHCEGTLGSVSENFKRNLAIEVDSIEEAGPHYTDPARFVDADMVFRKFYCPNCGTMLFTETARDGDPVLDEFDIADGGRA